MAPNIPTIQPTIGPGPAVGLARARPQPVESAGGALADLGQAAMQVAGVVARQDEEDAKAWALKAEADTKLWTQTELVAAKENAGPGAVDFTPNFTKSFDDFVEKKSGEAPNPRAAKKFREFTLNYRPAVAGSALEFEADARWKDRENTAASAADTTASALFQNPGNYDVEIQEYSKKIDEMDLPPTKKADLKAKATQKFSDAAVRADIRINPNAAYAALTGGNASPYIANLRAAESNGGQNIPNAAGTSSAFGPYQFTKGTWDELAARNPDLGLTPMDRFNPEKQEIAIARFTKENAETLTANNIAPTDRNLYMAHFLGAAGAVRFLNGLKSNPEAAGVSLADADAVKANRSVFFRRDGSERSAGEIYALMTNRFGNGSTFERSEGGRVPAPYSGLSPESRIQLASLAEREVNERRNAGRAEFAQRVQDSNASYLATGTAPNAPTRDEFIAQYGFERGERAYEEMEANAAFGGDLARVSQLTPAEQSEMLASYAPQPGEGFESAQKRYQMLAQAITARRKDLVEDPAAYSARYSGNVAAAWNNLSASLSNAVADPVAATAAARRYATASLLEQERLGVPETARRIVPKAYIESLQSEFARPLPEGGTEALVQKIEGLSELWGENWPRVYQEIAGDLSPTVRVIGSGISRGAAMVLAETANKNLDEILKAAPGVTSKQVKDAVGSAFEPLGRSLVGTEYGTQTYADFAGQGEKLAAFYSTQGMNPEDAAVRAFNETIGNKYEFADTWRLPRSAGADMAEVETGARERLAALTAEEIRPPADDMGGLSEKYRSESAVAAIRRNGTWVTAPDESGLVLMYGDRAVMVRANTTPGGRPILQNEDGSISTEETITVEVDGRWLNIPTIVNGERVDETAAVEAFRRGENPATGDFATLVEAERAARARSEALADVQWRPLVVPWSELSAAGRERLAMTPHKAAEETKRRMLLRGFGRDAVAQ